MTGIVILFILLKIIIASDSSVTVGNVKSFNHAQKQFLLKENPTFAIVFYGAADFGGKPVDALVDLFKGRCDLEGIDNIQSIFEEFLKFLSKNTEKISLKSFVNYNLVSFKTEIDEKIKLMNKKMFDDFIGSYDRCEVFDFLDGIDILFKDIIPSFITESEEYEKIFLEMFCKYIRGNSVGVVITGFDLDKTYPSFINFELFFNNEGNVEYSIIDWDENIEEVSIVPFAQTDVVESFLNGISSEIDDFIHNNCNSFIEGCIDEVYMHSLINGVFDEENLSKLKDVCKIIKEEINLSNSFIENIDRMKASELYELKDILDELPDEYLVELSEFLIYLTSIKRKFSYNLNSVGGDVDVSLLTPVSFKWCRKNNFCK